jgi:hypothetical protein
MPQLYPPFIHEGKTARLDCAALSFTVRSGWHPRLQLIWLPLVMAVTHYSVVGFDIDLA